MTAPSEKEGAFTLDVADPATRARMRAIRRRDTAAELAMRRALWSSGFRYRKNYRVARTTPDVVFLGRRVAVFVDGCFWHGCPRHYKPPLRNSGFWAQRLAKNQARDARDTLRLQSAGWHVLRFWECEIRRDLARVVDDVKVSLT
jgi:DNA mismatch endonuclease (patch repair protein)